MELPFSPASERNKKPIGEVLQSYALHGDILEIGHGTGQHAEYLASLLPVKWWPSDVEENNWMMAERLEQLPAKLRERIALPLSIRVQDGTSLSDQLGRVFDHLFSANTLHIMTEDEAYLFCTEVGQIIKDDGNLFLYGPFLYDGQATSQSNRDFDADLRSRGAGMGLREFSVLAQKLASMFEFIQRHDLPANNQLLVFKKRMSSS
jgi:cyclopropane fatty-acyl-phospholipid synthase-like methyltransferase